MDGAEAWEVLQTPDAPRLAILDWMMPGMDGIDVCRRARALDTRQPPYILLLTALSERDDMMTGFEAGATACASPATRRSCARGSRWAAGSELGELLERLRGAASRAPFKVDGGGLVVTVSVGGAVFAGESMDALIARTDDALYEAKARGRDLVVLAET